MNALLPTSLAQIVNLRARETPDTTALLVGNKCLSYQALAIEAARLGTALASIGVLADGILACAAKADDLALATIACSWAGIPFLPLAPDTTTARWQHLRALAPERLHRIDNLPAASTRTMAPAPAKADDPALVIATSGSEGLPKAVVLSHAALAAAARNSATAIPLRPGDAWLDCLPLNHIGGQAILWRCLSAGATVHLHDGFDAAAVWRDIAAGKASHLSLVPAMLAHLLEIADRPPPPTLRCVLVGGAALSRLLWARATQAGWPLHVSYGMSETAAQITTLPPANHWHEGLVGHPLPGAEITIDTDGRVRIRSPQLMLGYLGAEGEDVGIENGWLRTGDLGRIGEDGALSLLGRADDVLISAGVNIHPQEVEAQLAACPGVFDVAVTATPDPVWGDTLAALVVGPVEPAAIREWSRTHLPSAMHPRRFERVASLPRNALGKLERHALPALLDGVAT
jgi:O-succinylbenzoic acid--CoA ligase